MSLPEGAAFVTRFAPSPTGPLHLGHAFSAGFAFEMAKERGGRFLLRLEDLDRERSKPAYEALIAEDLSWLGLSWPEPVMRQSERGAAYRDALQQLWDAGLLYPCTCRRKDIRAAARAPQEGGDPLIGPDGIVYPGTCRGAPRTGPVPWHEALRLDMRLAMERAGTVSFEEHGEAPGHRIATCRQMTEEVGDVVLSRRGWDASYHLAVVVDDAAQGVSAVVRGQDLAEATPIHVLLQILLGLPRPAYLHHRLIRDESGKRLAKRDDARAISAYREAGMSAGEMRALIGL
ncbi:tRNA glutamyl-Q(34) synthetase GluQRS [Tropicimonas sp. IMCC34011]|uniref:tRNA glutamyl-Q(34) synthetase GluQRS n=1 Tax=Tropicimonas sp. IMCC34011 TaxID=2248759 RepID=UPI000E22189F|nr:tRNA glutamyl-Q(34) synthetase GluQRS [Tropicimonas sp. IMCC34011]